MTTALLIKAAQRYTQLRHKVIKNSRAYDSLYQQLQQAMTRAWTTSMRAAIIESLDRLRELGPGKFRQVDADHLMRLLESRVGTQAITAAMTGPVLKLSDALSRLGSKELGKLIGVDIKFNRADLDALDVLKRGNLFWVGQSWNSYTNNRLRAALNTYFTEGMTRQGLVQRFADDFAGMSKKGIIYWHLMADHTATRTREVGRVTAYQRADVQYVQVRAHIDDRTTPICKQLNGKVIPVRRLVSQRDAWLDAVDRQNPVAAKQAWTMHGADADDLSNVGGDKLPQHTASPPYHFRCRTITVAHFK